MYIGPGIRFVYFEAPGVSPALFHVRKTDYFVPIPYQPGQELIQLAGQAAVAQLAALVRTPPVGAFEFPVCGKKCSRSIVSRSNAARISRLQPLGFCRAEHALPVGRIGNNTPRCHSAVSLTGRSINRGFTPAFCACRLHSSICAGRYRCLQYRRRRIDGVARLLAGYLECAPGEKRPVFAAKPRFKPARGFARS
jgi:hypothetical protein